MHFRHAMLNFMMVLLGCNPIINQVASVLNFHISYKIFCAGIAQQPCASYHKTLNCHIESAHKLLEVIV